MSCLCKSIKFRSLIKQLTKQEFVQLMTQIFDDSTNLIETALFNHFISSENHIDNELNNVNSILSNIIQSRKPKPNRLKALNCNNIKCDQLPLQLIGHIAAFLDEWSYFQFQNVNRCIFVGCNSPNMLRKLDLINIKQYKSINLSEYRSLKQLEINIHKFNELILPTKNGQFIMNELDELLLDAKEATNCDIESFINQNCINFENIQSLKLWDFGNIDEDKEFDDETFCKILTKFSNVEYLELRQVFIHHLKDIDKLKKLWPKLRGLSVRGGSFNMNNNLVNIFGDDLEFLHHMNGHSNFENVNFNKLQQLILINPDMNTINNIFKTATNLRKVHIMLLQQNESELKNVISDIFKCKSLEYLKIAANNNQRHIAISEAIEMGLYETKNWKRNKFKIHIYVCLMERVIDTKGAIFNIGGIIPRLEASNINNFMFTWNLQYIYKRNRKQLSKREILRNINDISSHVTITRDGWRFIITNNECKLNGWSESWMIPFIFT